MKLDWQKQIQNPYSTCENQQCQNQNDHWYGCLHWHTRQDCFRTHQSEEQHHTATIVHVFACLQVNQSISSKRANPKHQLLPKPTMQHTVTCTRKRSWVTLQLQNCYCSRNSQLTSEPHTWPYSTTRLTKYPTLFQGIGKLRRVEVKLHVHIDERINLVAQQPRRIPFHARQKVEAELHELEKRYTCNWACIWSYSLGFSLAITPEKKWRSMHLRKYESSKSGYNKRVTPLTYSRWSHTYLERSHCILQAWS